jgi:methylated-DNA-[protein]-cysteine S-methyltransferase
MQITYASPTSLKGQTAEYANVNTPFGPALLALCGGKICWLNYAQPHENAEQKLRDFWKHGLVMPAGSDLQPIADRLFAGKSDLGFLLAGTPFQHRVWQALAEMKSGETMSYGQLASKIGSPKAARAIGGAVGANPVVYFIPCHRILASNGTLHGFGCGLPLKEKLLAAEGFKAAA